MMRTATINLDSPDYNPAMNAFFWAMNNARKLGFMPPTELILAEQLMRGDVRLLYYSNSATGVFSIAESKDCDFFDEDGDDIMALISKVSKRRRAKRLSPSNREMIAEDIGILSPSTGDSHE